MGNLGAYQQMTTIAKKFGGPQGLLAVTALGGYALLRPAEAGVRRAVRAFRRRGAPCATQGQVFVVTSAGHDVGGLAVQEGDAYRVLECDGDAVLVELIGRADNPHFVSLGFLSSISDFPRTPDSESQ